MDRIECAPRDGWPQILDRDAGISYHSGGAEPATGGDDGRLWWAEDVRYEFTEAEVDRIEEATEELHARCLDAADRAVSLGPDALGEIFGLPRWFADYAARSWRRGDPALLGRMDLAFDPATGDVSLLEYNADTPTLAVETAVAQWQWLEALHPDADQFNSLHERLIGRLGEIGGLVGGETLHFVAQESSAEEWAHASYYADLAAQAGVRAALVNLPDIGWDGAAFRDLENNPIRFFHKLHPWEWVREEEFGRHLAPEDAAREPAGVLEPPWKAILSDKAVLPLLHEMFPRHPNILPAFRGRVSEADGPVPGGDWVEKPCLGREGANVRMLTAGGRAVVDETGGPYGAPGARFVTQRRARLTTFEGGWTALVGSWMVGDKAAGMILRESRAKILQDNSRVVPHLFR